MRRHLRLLPALLLFAGFLSAPARAIEIVSSTLPGATQLGLGDQVSYEMVVGGTAEPVPTTYPYTVWVNGTDFYGNAVYFPVANGAVSVLGSGVLPSGGATAVATLESTASVWSIVVTNGGTGYDSAPAVTFSGGGGSGAAATAILSAPGGVTGFNVTAQGSGYTASALPTVNISGGGGSGAAGTAILTTSGGVIDTVRVSGGSNYTTAPSVGFSGGGGTNASAKATLEETGRVKNITPFFSGSGYSSPPTVNFTGGGGSNAAATAVVNGGQVVAVIVTDGGSGYSEPPGVYFTGGGGTGASANAEIGRAVKSLEMAANGSGYSSDPVVTFSGGGGTGANFTAVRGFGVESIQVDNSGSNYSTVPTVKLLGGSGSGATAEALIGRRVQSVVVDNPGSGYTNAPTVTFSGSGGAGADALIRYSVKSVTVNNGGTNYVKTPDITFSGGGGSNAAAVAAIGGGKVTGISVTNGGSGYTNAPSVLIGDGGGVTNTATTDKILGQWIVPGDGTLHGAYNLNIAVYKPAGTGATAQVASLTNYSSFGATYTNGIATFNVTKGGTNYTYPPYVVITDTNGFGAEAVSQINTTNGVVTNVVIAKNKLGLPIYGQGYSTDLTNITVELTTTPPDKKYLGNNTALPVQTSGSLSVVVPPNIGAGPNPALGYPAVTYQAGNYMGGDIIRFTAKWVNGSYDVTTGKFGGTRPLSEVEADQYTSDLRLTSNPEFGDANNDDFLLSRLLWAGDVRGIPGQTSVVRKVSVTLNKPSDASLPTYGLSGVANTERVYSPQEDDAFLDIGEEVDVSLEQMIPQNFSGSYFVAMKMTLSGDTDNTDDTFVSNQANKITVLTTASPMIEPASAVSTANGTFVKGGDAASDFSSINENGNYIVFASRASNLLAPPQGGTYQATSGQQIFLKLRQSREVVLASSTVVGTQANADCFNPSISADGRYIAYDSIASNIVSGAATGGRSMIYVFDTQSYTTAIVSKSAAGTLANGDSFRPRMSQSGRFVAFQSLARNLDAARPLQATNRNQQIYVHDRDVSGSGTFDTPGNIATYLVSLNDSGEVATGLCQNPVVNLDDTSDEIAVNSGMHVAYTSYAPNLPSPTGYAMVYRVSITPGTGPDPGSVIPISVNDEGAPSLNIDGSKDLSGTTIIPIADQASINGDGSQIAFTCAGNNLVQNANDGTYVPTYPVDNDPTVIPGGDYNRVPDIFVRDLDAGKTVRVSESRERVATGTITFYSDSWNPEFQPGGVPFGNEPSNTPADGDYLLISDGTQSIRFIFADTPGTDTPTQKYVRIVPGDVNETRWNLNDKISSSGLNITTEISNPPDFDPNVTEHRTMGYIPSIYLYNNTPGVAGNVTIESGSNVILVSGMSGGGTQAESGYMQGVPFGSNEPAIDRSGRFVAFRSIATNLDVHEATAQNTYPGTPATGELIRPLIFPTSNVFLHDREANGDPASGFDVDGNTTTTRASVNNFGYKTWIDAKEVDGIRSTKSANNNQPGLSADGRFVTFSSDAMGEGGLIFGPNNLTPLDSDNIKDVFVYDRRTVGSNPTTPNTAPVVSISSPANGLQVVPGTQITVSATATPSVPKTISSVELFVNTVSQGVLTSAPFSWNYTLANAGTYSILVVATDSKGITGQASVSVTAYQPQVPSNPAAGSNEKFVVDYFQKIFLRQPTYAEYADYLSLLNAGLTQAEVIQAMMESDTYNANENVLFGYYLRMGIAPTNKSAFQTILENMTSGTNATLLPSTMSAGVSGVPNLPPSPYSATIGQSLAAQTLINLVPNTFSNRLVRNLLPTNFVDWTWRTFNQPYLPQSMSQSNVASMGNKGDILATISNYPTTNSRYGATYAFMSALYANMPLANVGNTNLRATLASFDGQVKGLAVNYLLTPTNTWATNTGPLTTAMISNLLPPVITNSGTNTIPINVLYSNVIGGQNLFTNTVYYGSNLPTGIVATNIGGTGFIVGTPTASGTNISKIYASNGPGLIGSNTVKFVVLPPPPAVTARSYTGVVGEPFTATLVVANSPTNFALLASPTLPLGLSLNVTNGVISGTPMLAGTTTNRIAAYNSGGSSSANIVFAFEPAFASYATQYNLTGASAAPSADPDGDGYSNAKEFAFGMDPTKPDALPVKVESGNGKVTVTWVRRKNSLITYTVQASPALSGASAAWGAVTPAPTVQVLGNVGDAYERVKAEITMSGSTQFYRVEAFLPSGAL